MLYINLHMSFLIFCFRVHYWLLHGPIPHLTYFSTTAEYLGFEQYIPPFATANGTETLFGVNYASGSAGILDETAEQLVHFPLLD